MPTIVIDSIGSGKDYSTVDTWGSATDGDLVGDDEVHIGQMYDDEDTGGSVAIFGATTDATRYRRLEPAPGLKYDLVAGTGIVMSDTVGYRPLILSEDYAQAGDIRFVGQLSIGLFGGDQHLAEDVVIEHNNPVPNSAVEIKSEATLRNAAIVPGANDAFSGVAFDSSNEVILQNVTVDGATDYGFYHQFGPATAADFVMVNCAAVNNGTDDFNGTFTDGTINNNLSSDATAPGTSAQLSKSSASTFTDPAGDDYSPRPSGSAYDNGADLSVSFTDDLAGNTRAGAWEIGAYDESAASATLAQPAPAAIELAGSTGVVVHVFPQSVLAQPAPAEITLAAGQNGSLCRARPTQKERIQNALIAAGWAGAYPTVTTAIDTEKRFVTVAAPCVAPASVRADEAFSRFSKPRRSRRRAPGLTQERSTWVWKLALVFNEEVCLELFEASLNRSVIRLPATDDLPQVLLRLDFSNPQHPAQQSPSGGTKVTLTFNAKIAPQ